MSEKTLGDYQIIKQIGVGALGVVYLAEHRFMKQQVVLKVLPEELSNDRGFIQRFEEDVAILSTLKHPHIVSLHNISYADGQYFLVSDCIVDELGETTNLSHVIASKRDSLKEEEILDILKQIASALDYAHQKKIGNQPLVHRNLKPNNILLGKKGSSWNVYVCDFGLSRIVGSGTVLTMTYQAMAESLGVRDLLSPFATGASYKAAADGEKTNQLIHSFLQTFAFLSPEQKRNEEARISIETDVYAFGVLAYLLLAKDLPEGLFPLPSQLNAGWTHDWDPLIVGCLAKDPDDRVKELEPLFHPQQPAQTDLVEKLEKKQATVFLKEAKPVQIETATPAAGSLQPVIHHSTIERPTVDPDPAAAFRVDSTVKHYTPKKQEAKNLEPIQTEMVVIAGGTFSRGSNEGTRDENPRHQVHLNSFAIDIHPVTNEQFVRFLEMMGGEKDSNHNDLIRLKDSRIKRTAGKFSIESGYKMHPVVGITWYGAVGYAKWVGKRLPTEAEWEIAASSGEEGLLYPTGSEIEKTQANFFSSDTTPVQSYAPSPLGLYDMAGNVYEWCQDWYGYNYYDISTQEPENPTGPVQGVYRVLRGGCWKSLKEDLRCAKRHRNNPGTVTGTYGFRCAADVRQS